ncbi:MAG: enoyl-CoA hydratase/isomerase family protein, partial [Xanthomonadaceae bacterium]|nr:enoyl-CoA hydratase/isomerase family protein [Xanthomonadaceae bacterium]
MAEPLLIERAGPVLRLRMNRPQLHNAFDPALIAALTCALQAA